MEPPRNGERPMERPKLTHVAIRLDGVTHSLPAPHRHADIISMMFRADRELEYERLEREGTFGFVDESGRFLSRQQALISARVNDQIIDETKVMHGSLFSEGVW